MWMAAVNTVASLDGGYLLEYDPRYIPVCIPEPVKAIQCSYCRTKRYSSMSQCESCGARQTEEV